MRQTPSTGKEIDTADRLPSDPSTNFTLELMKMGSHDSYICLVPGPLDIDPPTTDDQPTANASPARTWSLLQPLTGTCLYHRQGWFTYSYCHNNEIRQFKELMQANPHQSGGAYKPEENPEWEAYTLGRPPTNSNTGVDLTVTDQNAHSAGLELVRNAGSHYLVQRWGDGTICDKTGRSREVEVQFHCSMTMTDDTILFVKETKTCSYVLAIHTPRLCAEPGFKSRLDSNGEAEIHCREIIPNALPVSEATSTDPSATSAADANINQAGVPLPVADHPLKISRSRAVEPLAGKQLGQGSQKDKMYEELLRKALEALFGDNAKLATGKSQILQGIVIDDGTGGVSEGSVEQSSEIMDRLTETLRAAGYEVETGRGEQNAADNQERDEEVDLLDHDEL